MRSRPHGEIAANLNEAPLPRLILEVRKYPCGDAMIEGVFPRLLNSSSKPPRELVHQSLEC